MKSGTLGKNCPFCGSDIPWNPANIALSAKKREVFEFIARGGPKGVHLDDVMRRFFPKPSSPITLRTTIHYINKAVHPLQIFCIGKVFRVGKPGIENIE